MILVDTSVLVAWFDESHPEHARCWKAIREAARTDELAVSSMTYAELAAGGRTIESVDEALKPFARIDLDFASAWRAGKVFRASHPGKGASQVLPDFFIRAQAAVLGVRHLTNDRRRIQPWADVDFIFPE